MIPQGIRTPECSCPAHTLPGRLDRLQILTIIPALKPTSISELAKAMKKDFKNIHSDLTFIADIGLIELREKDPRKTLGPIAKFDDIELALAA